ncbi:glycogen synthase GlgA [Roseomonas sp. CECT 9278]|uniref:glycogen synthase GlgA n=1 Tax=Roseomonas sp. CECT 9278 TaxID=2845823 RepID=UPI001E38D2A1|nr:glycogen synthase GlgA [Roseomonas sp. CECT 9278]CAH0279659.1 Glycogen synthase 1 [Roseomonas sp. CECT 9278]
MKVLAVASEAYPLIKTGGLADAVGALPKALAAQGVQVTTLLPQYRAVGAAFAKGRVVLDLPDLFGRPARILESPGAPGMMALDAPHLFDRPGGPYAAPGGGEWGDTAIRFAALGRAGALLAQAMRADVLHAHDWQAGLAPAYLRFAPRRIPCLFTIHNMAYQGKFPAAVFPALGLPDAAFAREGLEYYGAIGFLKAGLWFADAINTVSPSYAEEILTPEGGMGLDGLLRGRAGDLHGILNGLDVTDWDPARDAALAATFSADDPAPRAANKAALQARFGLAVDAAAPLFAFVGRLAWQKGADLLLEAAPVLMQGGAQLALLGSGDAPLEHACRGFAAAHEGRAGAFIGFDEGLARLAYGGADMLVVPSRFEPCGLAQLAALRYGAVPVVARTGGLADTVIDASPMALAAACATGIQVAAGRADALAAGFRRALALYRDAPTWRGMQGRGMATDVSWGPSAARYAAVLERLASRHG